ncbi:protein kinase C iota type-like [Dermacentor variabilis]|uniref:protein kinase C iota type-like n=1 Tax=Dermacentor variabilis TaxID=34621 RepID=UPI003F5C95B4
MSSRARREIDISTSHSSTVAPSRANESADFQQAQFVHVPPPPLLNLPTVTLERAGSREEVAMMDSETTAGSHRRELRGPKMRFLSRLIPSRLSQSHPGSLSQSVFEKDDERSHMTMSMRSKLSSWKTFSVFSQMVEKPRLESLREWSFSRIVVIDILRTRKQDLVCSARHTFSGEWAILKIVWKRRFRSKKADITRERKVWESVSDCQFIVGLKAYFKTAQCYCFVAEYYEGCTLQSLLEEGALRDDVIVNIVANVTYALKYIHDRDMMYRNISPTTILIDMTGIARLFDFAFCSVGKTSSSRVGSIPYMAPEVLRMEVYDRTSDYWSLGILAYVLYVRHTPMSIYSAKTNLDHWVDRDYMYQYAEVVPITLPKHMPPHAKSLISGLLVERPRLRLGCRSTGFYEVMKHPFFRHVDWDSFTRFYNGDILSQSERPLQPSMRF